jgi:phosphoenolpyruvate synthase/pyruvate phosphate dikinase
MRRRIEWAIGAVFDSWMIPRAKKYRELNAIPASWGTASGHRRP